MYDLKILKSMLDMKNYSSRYFLISILFLLRCMYIYPYRQIRNYLSHRNVKIRHVYDQTHYLNSLQLVLRVIVDYRSKL